MKLLVQSDDYGITKAAAAGVIEGIRNGIIRNTGLFANMPWAEECVEWIYPYLDQIAFGIDLNVSTGSSLLGHDKVPSLCHEDGSFLTSRENRALDTDENDHDHVIYEEVYAEFEAQIRKFVELTGRLPDYFHSHAYGTKTTFMAIDDLSEKYHRVHILKYMEKLGSPYAKMSWVKMGEPSIQVQSDLKSYILNDEAAFLKKDLAYLVTHCGYVDQTLMELSSFNLVRMRDLDALTSKEVKNWIRENSIELVTTKDVVKEHEDELA